MKQKKSNKQKDILFILISSFVLVVIWIGFNLVHIWATSTISEDVQSKLTPISGSFDVQVIQQLKNRTQVNPIYEKSNTTQSNQQLSPSPTENIPATNSAVQLEPTQNPIIRLGQ